MIYLGVGCCNSFGASRGLFFQRRWSILGIGILYRKNTYMYVYVYEYNIIEPIIEKNASLNSIVRKWSILNGGYEQKHMPSWDDIGRKKIRRNRLHIIFLLRRWPLLSFVGVPQFFWGRDVDPNYKGFPAKMVANSILNASKWCWKWLSKNNFPKPLNVDFWTP